MSGRRFSAGNAYRYSFNGKEDDNEIAEGIQDYGERHYSKRLGRLLSIDPLTKKIPFYTPYNFAGNKPIMCIDYLGLQDIPAASGDPNSINYSIEKFTQIAKSDVGYSEGVKNNRNVVLKLSYVVIPNGVDIHDYSKRVNVERAITLNTATGFNPPATRSAETTIINISGQYFESGRPAVSTYHTLTYGSEPAYRYGQTVTTAPVMTPQVATTPIVAPFNRNLATLPPASITTINNFISTIPATANNLNATVGIGFSRGQTGIAGPFANATLLANARGRTIQGLFASGGFALSLNPPAFNTSPQITVSYQTNNLIQTGTNVTTQPIRQALSNGTPTGAVQNNGAATTGTVPAGGAVPAAGTTWNN